MFLIPVWIIILKRNNRDDIIIKSLKTKHSISDITLASEEILKQEWLSPEEEKLWENL